MLISYFLFILYIVNRIIIVENKWYFILRYLEKLFYRMCLEYVMFIIFFK